MTLDERISLYLAKCPPAVSGSDGHGVTFRVACALVNGFALSEDDALRHLTTYNATCCPPWKPRELRHKVQQAAKVTHEKPRGHLVGQEENRPAAAVSRGAKPAAVRLTPKEPRSRTLGTLLFNPYTHTRNKEHAHTYKDLGDDAASQASQTGQTPVEAPPLADEPIEPVTSDDGSAETFGAVNVPGCSLVRPEEIACTDDTWRILAAHPLGLEPMIHQAFALFGPDCTITSTGEDEPCES